MTATVWANVTDILWPVGSIYRCESVTANTPAVMFGGFWRALHTEYINGDGYNIWYRYA